MSALSQYLSDASLGLVLVGLALSQLGLPLPETVFVVAAGVVSERAGLSLHVPLWSSCVAVMLGDLMLYYWARSIGLDALERRPLCWLVPARVRPRVDVLFERHGKMTIFVARFIVGVRLAAFALAGMRRVPVARFVLWDGLAIVLTVPIFAALGFVFAANAEALNRHVTAANQLMAAVLGLVVVVYLTIVFLRRRGKDSAKSAGAARGRE